jgi:hypothetical protein
MLVGKAGESSSASERVEEKKASLRPWRAQRVVCLYIRSRLATLAQHMRAAMVLKLPRAAEREYIATSGIVAIYVAALPSGPTRVAISRDLLHSLLAIRRRWPGTLITSAFWLKEKTEARLIVREVHNSFGHGSEGLLVANAKAAQRRVENVAAHIGIDLTEHAVVLQRARAAVGYIENRMEELQQAGELSWFNAAYREWRLEAKRHGRHLCYAAARARLRQAMFQQILNSESQQFPNRLFPALPTLNLN